MFTGWYDGAIFRDKWRVHWRPETGHLQVFDSKVRPSRQILIDEKSTRTLPKSTDLMRMTDQKNADNMVFWWPDKVTVDKSSMVDADFAMRLKQYIARGDVQGLLLPGVHASFAVSLHFWDNAVYNVTEAEYLQASPGSLMWVLARDGAVPPNGLAMGTTENGEPTYTTRVLGSGFASIGVLLPNEAGSRLLTDIIDDVLYKEYEVLSLAPGKQSGKSKLNRGPAIKESPGFKLRDSLAPVLKKPFKYFPPTGGRYYSYEKQSGGSSPSVSLPDSSDSDSGRDYSKSLCGQAIPPEVFGALHISEDAYAKPGVSYVDNLDEPSTSLELQSFRRFAPDSDDDDLEVLLSKYSSDDKESLADMINCVPDIKTDRDWYPSGDDCSLDGVEPWPFDESVQRQLERGTRLRIPCVDFGDSDLCDRSFWKTRFNSEVLMREGDQDPSSSELDDFPRPEAYNPDRVLELHRALGYDLNEMEQAVCREDDDEDEDDEPPMLNMPQWRDVDGFTLRELIQNGEVVRGGKGFDGHDLWVSRFAFRGHLLPDGHDRGDMISSELLFLEVLVVPRGCPFRPEWVVAREGDVPPCAFPAGHTNDGEVAYVARARHAGCLLPGRLLVSEGGCLVRDCLRMEMVLCKIYEVLSFQ